MLATGLTWVPSMPVATIAAPSSQGISWSARARTPLIALTVALVALDAIGLGLRWADASNNAIGEIAPRVLKPGIAAPDAVVSGSDLPSISSGTNVRTSDPEGVTSPGPLVGPVAPPVARPTPTAPTPTPAPAVPLAQIDIAIPGLAQISLGAGDNSCTTIDLTLLALGNCPMPTGDGPVILHLGGSLLGQ